MFDGLVEVLLQFLLDGGEAWRAARARELLEAFGLWEKREVRADTFSKGMRRRLSIAMALIHRPSLLFLDEPTPELDAQSTRAMCDLVRQMNAEGTTIFLTTHQIEEANLLCDRVAIIDHGRFAAIDTPERLKETFRRVQSVEVALEPALISGNRSQLRKESGKRLWKSNQIHHIRMRREEYKRTLRIRCTYPGNGVH